MLSLSTRWRQLLLCFCTQVLPTSEKIDIEKLKVRDKINFYADVLLFEDELSDNGCSVLRAKIVSTRRDGGREGGGR